LQTSKSAGIHKRAGKTGVVVWTAFRW
jgi:hypothetical protein